MSYKKFQDTVWKHYENNARVFLWRETKDPYHILISEIMLQQTGVARVTLKYQEFLRMFPTIADLANAELRDVLHVWLGLGYNRRAKNLHTTAKQITSQYGTTLPREYSSLLSLPGIGQSTAGAIMNFSFEIPTPFIETNIRTVFIHHFFKDKDIKVSDEKILELVSKTMSDERPREWFYALYDYGTFLKQTLKTDPAKKSRGYKKQSKFKGSFREKRSFILRELLKKKMTEKEIKNLVKKNFDSQDGKEVTLALLKDKMIVLEKKFYKVA